VSELNPLWLPIVTISPPPPDPVERLLRIVWSYEATPVRIAKSQRYSLSLTEPCPEPVWRKA